jgi:GTP-binding protein HflX
LNGERNLKKLEYMSLNPNKNKKLFENKKIQEKAYIIGLLTKDKNKEQYQESMAELKRLAQTAETQVIKSFIQYLDKPNPASWIGSGKLQEILKEAKNDQISTLIFNDNLSPAQARNIAKLSKCNIVDRTELILDIFSQHAKTKESKLQIELAQLEYSYSKLRNLWQHFSRIEGGIGLRGPGEKQLELDRRLVKQRITLLKEKLNDIKKATETKRKRRDNIISVCLVGYTNAGKSTLFNLLTKSNIYTADKLFATLDATTRSIKSIETEKLLITDTIGFINELPPTLIQSFYSTLYEVREADLLLHIIDSSNPRVTEMIDSVDKVLKEINCDHKNILHVFNKWDLCNDLTHKFLKKHLSEKYKDSIFISAKENLNIEDLFEKINFYLHKRKIHKFYTIPIQMGKLIDFIHNKAVILDSHLSEDEENLVFDILIDFKLIKNIENQLHEYSILNNINSKK